MCCPHWAQSNAEIIVWHLPQAEKQNPLTPILGPALGAEGLSALNKVRGALPEELRAPEVRSLNTVRQAGEAVWKQGESTGRK